MLPQHNHYRQTRSPGSEGSDNEGAGSIGRATDGAVRSRAGILGMVRLQVHARTRTNININRLQGPLPGSPCYYGKHLMFWKEFHEEKAHISVIKQDIVNDFSQTLNPGYVNVFGWAGGSIVLFTWV